MRRIFTLLLSVLFFTAVSKVNAQTCSGFTTTATGSYNTTVLNPNVVLAGNATSETFTSNVYYSNTAQTRIDFGFRLFTGNQGQNTTLGATVTIRWGTGGSSTFYTCNATATTGLNINSPGSLYYLSIQLGVGVTIPASTNFEIEVTFTKASNQSSVTFTEFLLETDAILAIGGVLPVKFGAFTAKNSASAVQLNWTIDAEENTKAYEIERSADGRKFTSIGSVNATGARSYQFMDASPLASAHYRIKAIDLDGQFGYSIVLRMKGSSSGVDMKGFFPNQGTLALQHDMAPAGSRITLVSAEGRVLRSVLVAEGSQQTQVDVASVLPGLLMVRFETGSGKVETIKIVKQK
jgi:hypothetical protein